MITVHHLNNSRSQRLLWLLEKLIAIYEVKRYQRDAKTMLAPRELTRIQPLGNSPVITDNGNTIAEAGTPERLRFTYWLHYAEVLAMTPLLLKLILTHIPNSAPGLMRGLLRSVMPKVQEHVSDPEVLLHMNYRGEELSKSPWFTGNEFTAADIIISFPLEAAASRAGGHSRPMIAAFLDRIHVRPACTNALKTGGPHEYTS
jgi:glutathione S-transferase